MTFGPARLPFARGNSPSSHYFPVSFPLASGLESGPGLGLRLGLVCWCFSKVGFLGFLWAREGSRLF